MFRKSDLLILMLIGSWAALSLSASAENLPEWMREADHEITPPTSLTAAQIQTCTDIILQQVNEHLSATFTAKDIAKVQMPNWQKEELGFIRGGGFNIRILNSKPSLENPQRRLHAGRFLRAKTWLKLGAEASLHIPDEINGHQAFYADEFVAHMDSGYAFLPLGLFIHLFTDVAGARTRPPCPTIDLQK